MHRLAQPYLDASRSRRIFENFMIVIANTLYDCGR